MIQSPNLGMNVSEYLYCINLYNYTLGMGMGGNTMMDNGMMGGGSIPSLMSMESSGNMGGSRSMGGRGDVRDQFKMFLGFYRGMYIFHFWGEWALWVGTLKNREIFYHIKLFILFPVSSNFLAKYDFWEI